MIEILKLDELRLVQYRDKIFDLFRACFRSDLDQSLWEWAYLSHAFGKPIVFIAAEDNLIVGHYAIIPIPFIQNENEILGYLSMTTMVHPNYVKFGLFSKLAELSYSEIGNKSFVFGFPNKFSKPGFKKRLHWAVSEAYKIITIHAEFLLNPVNVTQNKATLRLNLNNSTFLDWRLSKPNTKYTNNNGVIIKGGIDSSDILNFDSNLQFDIFKKKDKLNILTNDLNLIQKSISSKSYFFGFRNLGTDFEIVDFSPNLLMSDIF